MNIKTALICLITSLAGGLAVPSFATDPVPFVCTGEAFTVRDTPADLYQINQNVDPFVFDLIKSEITDKGVNNIGYRLVDNLIYGVKVDSGINNKNLGLVKIDSLGNIFPVTTQFTSGPYQGQPLESFPQIFAAGDIDTSLDKMYLNHYLLQNNFLEIDLSTGDITQKSFVSNPYAGRTIADWAVNPLDHNLYGAEGGVCTNGYGAVYRLNPIDKTVVSLGGIMGLPCNNVSGSAYGGSWFDAQGNLFVYRNGPDIIYQVDLDTKQVVTTQVGNTGGSNNNDAAACAAGVPIVSKFYTETNNNWEPICIEEVEVTNADGTISIECVSYEPANIETGDVFADQLMTNADGDFILWGDELAKKTVITPGQYIAVSEIRVPKEQPIWLLEDFSDCVDADGIGLVNPNKVPGGVQVVLIDPDGYVIPIGGDLANGIGGSIELTDTYAFIHVDSVPADSILRVMVKFQPFNELGMIGRSCTNHEIITDEDMTAITQDSAVLTVEPKPE